MWEKTNTLPSNTSKFNSESPKSVRKRFGSASEETILKVNGLSESSSLSLGPTEMESLKNDIIKEVRKEIAKMKQEILDGKLSSLINNHLRDNSEVKTVLEYTKKAEYILLIYF